MWRMSSNWIVWMLNWNNQSLKSLSPCLEVFYSVEFTHSWNYWLNFCGKRRYQKMCFVIIFKHLAVLDTSKLNWKSNTWGVPIWISIIHNEIILPGHKCCYFYCRCLDESARWLLINSRRQEATKLLKKIAKMNKKPLPEDMHISVTVGSIWEKDNREKQWRAN